MNLKRTDETGCQSDVFVSIEESQRSDALDVARKMDYYRARRDRRKLRVQIVHMQAAICLVSALAILFGLTGALFAIAFIQSMNLDSMNLDILPAVGFYVIAWFVMVVAYRILSPWKDRVQDVLDCYGEEIINNPTAGE